MALREPHGEYGHMHHGGGASVEQMRLHPIESGPRQRHLSLLQGGLAVKRTVEMAPLAGIGTHPSLEGIDQAWIDGEDLPDTGAEADYVATAFGNGHRPDLLRRHLPPSEK